MAVKKYAPINIANMTLANATNHPVLYWCDTTAELPSSGLKSGDTAYTKDTELYYKATGPTTWAPADTQLSLGSTPSTQAFGDLAAGGVATTASKNDHKHAMPANPAPAFATPAIVLGSAAAAGAATTVIRSNATIAAFDATVPVTQAFADAAATGAAAFAARRDHKHGMPSQVFTKNVTFFDASGVTAATILTWQSPTACTLTGMKAYRVGGTGATVNAYRNTTGSPLRSAALSLTTASTWTDGGAVQNTAFAVNDSLLFGLLTVAGAVTQVNIQLSFTRP